MTNVWQVKQDSEWGHKGRFGVQIDRDDHVSDDDGGTHAEIELKFDDRTWGWYPVTDLVEWVEVSA